MNPNLVNQFLWRAIVPTDLIRCSGEKEKSMRQAAEADFAGPGKLNFAGRKLETSQNLSPSETHA